MKKISDIKKLKTANNGSNIKIYILIIIFAIIFSLVVQDGIMLVVQKFLEIPTDYMGLALWGDTFFIRILASLFATATGTFIIGAFLRKKFRLIAVIATLPTILFWVAVLIFGIIVDISEPGYSFGSIKTMLILPIVLSILSPIVGYFSADLGHKYINIFQRPKSVLNIKWYHWFWILPFFLNKIVAVPLLVLISLIKFDFSYGWTGMYPGILDFITNWSYYLGRIILLFILMGLIASINHVYSLLTEEKITSKRIWRNGIIIFGHIVLFSVLYVLFFGEYL